jgi:hypothetical protein
MRGKRKRKVEREEGRGGRDGRSEDGRKKREKVALTSVSHDLKSSQSRSFSPF